jgi:hypothetical protein
MRHDDIDILMNQLSSELRKAVRLALRPAIFDYNVLPLDIPDLAQAMAKSLDTRGIIGWRSGPEKS